MKHGFTLVELSIVLVIIGFLIGGILVAQSMIATSKITAFVAQVQQFDAGVANFKTKYNALPGDAKPFGGDGDGVIALSEALGWSPPINNTFGCEVANFWNGINPQEFAASGCPDTNGVQAISDPGNAGRNVPLSKLGKTGSFVMAIAVSDLSVDANRADVVNIANYYVVTDPTEVQSGPYQFTLSGLTNSAVSPIEMLSLDKKIDDGLGTTGYVRSGRIGSGAGGGPQVTTPNWTYCSDAASGVYNVNAGSATANAYTCTPFIRIGGQTGDPS